MKKFSHFVSEWERSCCREVPDCIVLSQFVFGLNFSV